jgi:catechol 2,3-dioxygenase-like lactoylglutathione lyase family enzyme
VTRVWYRVRDLGEARAFYTGKLGFTETHAHDGWVQLERSRMQIALAEGEPEEGLVASVDVDDVRSEAERLRAEQVKTGIVLELHNEVRVVDVFDPDGNRLQLVQQLRPG